MANAQLTSFERQGYGVGAAPYSLANTIMIVFFAKFLVDEAGLAPIVAGAVLFVGKAWDAVTDPLVGRLSDRTHSPMGSRRVWTAFGIVPFALLLASLWVVYPLEGWALVAVYGVLLVAYSTAYTCYVIPYGAMSPVLTADYDERTWLNGARMTWAMLAGIVAAIVMPVCRGQTGTYSTGAVVIAAMMLPPAFVMLYATRGKDPGPTGGAAQTPGMWTVLRVPAFRRVVVLFLACWCSISVLGALLPFYVQDHLLRPDLEDAVFAVLQISALFSIPAVLWVATRYEKHRAYGVFIASWAACLVALALVPPGRGDVMLVLAAVFGPGVAAAHVLPWAMLPDVVEADRLANGVERAGAFYGVMTFLEKSGTAVALQSMLVGLQLAGYDRTLEVQSDLVRFTMTTMIGPVPAVVLFGAAAFAVLWPPMTREQHARALAALEARTPA
ncbi:MAG: MFS transporter [Myxococcota bacterium]